MKISTWIPVAAVAFNAAFAGGGQPPDTCYFDAGLRGVALDKTLTRPDDAFLVRKLYDGEHSVRTDLSTVELAVYSAAAANPDAHGGCLTYLIEGEGIDMTGNTDDNGERFKLNGIYDIAQENHYMVEFDDAGWTRITAKLKEGSVIRVTGEFGPYNPEYAEQAPNGRDRRRTLSTAGLLQGRTFYVIERSTPFGNGYVPTGYVYTGDDAEADPRVDATDMTATFALTTNIPDETDYIPLGYSSYNQATVPAGALFLKGTVTRSATTVFVVNKIDENKVGTIEVDVTDWDAPYDGEGHGAAVTMLSTFSDDDGEPLYDWWRASYALGDAEGPTNDWSAGTPLFTNVCEQTVWMAFDADYWRSTTTSAVVRIRPAALAITARDQTYVYNGRPQGEGDPVYTDPADIAAKVDVEGLAAGDALASIVLTGQRTEPGTEWIVPSGAVVTNATGDVTSNYDIGYTNGTLTIGAPAPPSVSNVVARQRWPWNGLVDVDYEVGGSTTGLVARISFAEQGGEGRAWVATNFLAGAEPSAEPGVHRATWDTAADGATNVVAGSVAATVELLQTPAPPLLSPVPVTPEPTAGARKLYSFLLENYGRKVVSGVMTERPFENDGKYTPQGYGTQTELKYVHDASGKDVVLVGLDFLHATGKNAEQEWYQGYTAASLALARTVWNAGGIPAFCWHWKDPMQEVESFYTQSSGNVPYTEFGIGRAYDATNGTWKTESAEYQAIVRDLETVADRLLELQEAGVAVVWRPLHEASDRWFWWGTDGPGPCVALYRLMFDVFVNRKGLRNLIWVWTTDGTENALDWYPGDDCVDVVGRDYYYYPRRSDHASLVDLFTAARDLFGGRKIVALTENGAVPYPAAMKADGAGWSWFMPWYGDYAMESWANDNDADSWNTVMNDEYTLTLEDMPGWE